MFATISFHTIHQIIAGLHALRLLAHWLPIWLSISLGILVAVSIAGAFANVLRRSSSEI